MSPPTDTTLTGSTEAECECECLSPFETEDRGREWSESDSGGDGVNDSN